MYYEASVYRDAALCKSCNVNSFVFYGLMNKPFIRVKTYLLHLQRSRWVNNFLKYYKLILEIVRNILLLVYGFSTGHYWSGSYVIFFPHRGPWMSWAFNSSLVSNSLYEKIWSNLHDRGCGQSFLKVSAEDHQGRPEAYMVLALGEKPHHLWRFQNRKT